MNLNGYTPATGDLSPDTQKFADGIVVAALALQCALQCGDKHSLSESSRELAVIYAIRHQQPGVDVDPEKWVDEMIQLQRKKLRSYTADAAGKFLAKTIERNGGHGTLPKTQSSVLSPQSSVQSNPENL
jgi:hypothetical protein